MLTAIHDRACLIDTLLNMPYEAANIKDDLVREFKTSRSQEDRSHLAELLTFVLEPEDSYLLLDPEITSDIDLFSRFIWAFGELHSPLLREPIMSLVYNKDSTIAGLALTALAKCDLSTQEQLRDFRLDPRRLVRKRYIEGFEQKVEHWSSPKTSVKTNRAWLRHGGCLAF